MTSQVLIEPPLVKTKEINHKILYFAFAESLKRQEITLISPNDNISLVTITVSAQIFDINCLYITNNLFFQW